MSNPTWLKPDTSTPSAHEPLPVGTYVAEILGAKNVDDKYLTIQMDVSEGDYKGYYTADFNAKKNNPKVTKPYYAGTLNLFFPKGDGSERDGWTISAFNKAIGAIEMSNNGYHFDFDKPAMLKGKKVGIAVREYNGYNDNTGKTFKNTEIGVLIDVEYARTGKMKPLKPKYSKNYPLEDVDNTSPVNIVPGAVIVDDDEELPFD